MKSKIADIFCSFCVSCVSLGIALLYRVDILSMLFILTLSITFSLFCCSFVNANLSSVWVKRCFGFGALISASSSICIACRLVCGYCLDNSFVPITVFLGCTVALCLALSSVRACKSVVSVMSLICIFFLLAIFILGIFESDFSKVISGISDRRILFPLSVFGVVDVIYIMPYIRKSNRCMFVVGSAIVPAYVLLTILFAVSTLSADIYYSLNTPIITMWQSCYVASFIDRFETVVLCAIFVVCIMKSGLFLKCVFDAFSKKAQPLMFVLFALSTIPLTLNPSLIYLYAALSLICALVYCVNFLLKKSY